MVVAEVAASEAVVAAADLEAAAAVAAVVVGVSEAAAVAEVDSDVKTLVLRSPSLSLATSAGQYRMTSSAKWT